MLRHVTDATWWLPAIYQRYLAHLAAEEIPDPLSQPVMVAAVLADLCTIAGVPVPIEIQARLSDSADLTPPATESIHA